MAKTRPQPPVTKDPADNANASQLGSITWNAHLFIAPGKDSNDSDGETISRSLFVQSITMPLIRSVPDVIVFGDRIFIQSELDIRKLNPSLPVNPALGDPPTHELVYVEAFAWHTAQGLYSAKGGPTPGNAPGTKRAAHLSQGDTVVLPDGKGGEIKRTVFNVRRDDDHPQFVHIIYNDQREPQKAKAKAGEGELVEDGDDVSPEVERVAANIRQHQSTMNANEIVHLSPH